MHVQQSKLSLSQHLFLVHPEELFGGGLEEVEQSRQVVKSSFALAQQIGEGGVAAPRAFPVEIHFRFRHSVAAAAAATIAAATATAVATATTVAIHAVTTAIPWYVKEGEKEGVMSRG